MENRHEQKYLVKLTVTERKQLREIIAKGKAPAYKIKHANILLKAEADWSDEKIAQAFGCNVNTPLNVRLFYILVFHWHNNSLAYLNYL